MRERNPNGEKIYFILDRGPSNKALSVRELAKKLNIEIVFLPAYSPNLNPIERLWKFLRKSFIQSVL
ncbi:MAG: hypothetical protein HOP07_15835 [Bacteriovoracaceae bacterium]|nr:hypothetical protein [Bacteriovoracaceae bacterium]